LFQRLSFQNASFSSPEALPVYEKMISIHSARVRIEGILTDKKVIPVSDSETQWLLKKGFTDTLFRLHVSLSVARKQPYAWVQLVPVRWNAHKALFEKLISFRVKLSVTDIPGVAGFKSQRLLTHSVLASGSWFKIRIEKSGIYKLTYEDLKSMGFPADGDPADIALYGNGGGPLPEKNDAPRPAGLTENPIEVVDGGDGNFGPGDYILFYGVGPVVWKYDASTGMFHHQNNYYDDYAYYFLTKGNRPGLRIRQKDVPGTPDTNITRFTDYAFHERDERNLGNTGRTWYGEVFDFASDYSFDFNFPHLVKTQKAWLKAVFASKAYSANSFEIYTNGQLQKTLYMPVTGNSEYDVGKGGSTRFSFSPASDKITVKTVYRRNSSSSVGYLDYLELNVQRELVFSGGQMAFRNILSSGNVARYNLQATGNVTVWDVSQPLSPESVKIRAVSGGVTFQTEVEQYKAFVAFDGTDFYKPVFVEKVENQDLHAVKNTDFLIVSYPGFLDQARRLADFHREKDGLKVFVTTPQKIYNEFSSGAQDITAIRDFVKHIYDRSDPGQELRYLLLFGDASFDYKNRLPDNTNFVPCWEAVSSLNTISSVASDDYFGYLDDGEGVSYSDRVDIGIGRFPVDTPEEAKEAVDKTIRYDTDTPETMGPWRNRLTFVADDGDYNRHLNDAETLSGYLSKNYPVYGLNKLYLDAFPQISTPSGQRAPALNEAINASIDGGTLLFNYSGHGGEVGLGHERFMTIADINSWTN
ncbi:MAG TPA: type IX secretion system sortase PorU, partial [Bacteroidetes bacterium]|nr:type IX secretion system sortase PorU [Bacteroidota bacterium]